MNQQVSRALGLCGIEVPIYQAGLGGGSDGFEAQLSVVLEERPKVLSLLWGDFARVISRGDQRP